MALNFFLRSTRCDCRSLRCQDRPTGYLLAVCRSTGGLAAGLPSRRGCPVARLLGCQVSRLSSAGLPDCPFARLLGCPIALCPRDACGVHKLLQGADLGALHIQSYGELKALL